MTSRCRRAWLVGALLLAAPLLVHGGAQAQALASLRPLIAARYPEVRWLDRATLARALERGEPVVLLDARTEAEVRVSHLRGARRIDPDAPRLDALDVPRDARVVVYCAVGWRSAAIADRMRLAGWTDVSNLEGGLFAWANAGGALHRGAARARTVHPYDATWGRLLDARLHPRRRAR